MLLDPLTVEAGEDGRWRHAPFPGDAVLGASIDVPLLDGQQSVEVPAGAQPDTILRLVGKGLPSFGGGPRGDLYVRLQVHVPERLTDRQRRLYEQLKATNPGK